jgi:hypothetical protein
MLIRTLTERDIPVWLALAHESDDVVLGLKRNLTVFYEGFDEYMERKIMQEEAFKAVDEESGKCLGIVAFSSNHNRISFIGVSKAVDFHEVGSRLMEFAFSRLDNAREITAKIIKSDARMIEQERALYERFNFKESDVKLEENGVPVIQMKKNPRKTTGVR